MTFSIFCILHCPDSVSLINISMQQHHLSLRRGLIVQTHLLEISALELTTSSDAVIVADSPWSALAAATAGGVLGYYLLIKPMRRKNIGECCPGQSLGFFAPRSRL